MGQWEYYLREHSSDILNWMAQFAPKHKTPLKAALDKVPFDQKLAFDILNEAWETCPDNLKIRTAGFFKLCDLLDGNVEDDENSDVA